MGQDPPVEEPVDEAEIPELPAELHDPEKEEGVGPAIDEPAQDEAEEAEGEELPAWLAELTARPPEGPEDLDQDDRYAEAPSLDEGKPSVERRIAEEDLTEEPSIELEPAELPAWLAELRPSREELESEEVLPTAPKPPSAELLPGWWADLSSDEEDSTAEERARAALDLPDWLVLGDAERGEKSEILTPADIPDWLKALKPSELRPEANSFQEGRGDPAEAVEETGLLAGLRGTLVAEMLIAQPRAAEAVDVTSMVVDTPQSRLFAEIVSRPPAPAPKEIAQPRADVLPRIVRWSIYLALVVAALVPLVLNRPMLSRQMVPAVAAQALYDRVQDLDGGASVLVAFDYDPTMSGEMDVIAETLLRHLMDRGVRLVSVSLLPAGPPVAQDMMDRIAAERPAYAAQYGEQYVNLGYVPGHASAVRLMGESLLQAFPRDFQGASSANLAATDGLTRTQSFDLIVELAATQETLRWWIEQASAPYGVELAAGVSASVDPLARPYFETDPRQLVGIVGGVLGAASYEMLREGGTDRVDAMGVRLDAQLAGHLVFVFILLIGNVTYWLRRWARRER